MGSVGKTIIDGAYGAGCRINNVWKAIESSSTFSETTSLETTLHYYCHTAKRDMSTGIIILSLGDAPFCVAFEAENDPARMTKLLNPRQSSSLTVSRPAVQTQLGRKSYKDQNMSFYID